MLSRELINARQALPLFYTKIDMSITRIMNFYDQFNGNVYVAFSGGKDSTALLHLVRSVYSDVPAVFVNTGLEYPEIVDFVKTIDNVTILRPRMGFRKVLSTYGYPVISKDVAGYVEQIKTAKSPKTVITRIHGQGRNRAGRLPEKWMFLLNAPFKISKRCCDVMKKEPFHRYERETGRHPIIGVMADESDARMKDYMKYGCNAMKVKRPQSRPIIFWKNEDIWEYIRHYNLSYCKIYDTGIGRTGCIFCGFGAHLNPVNRYKILKNTHPKLYEYCMKKLGFEEVLNYIGIDH